MFMMNMGGRNRFEHQQQISVFCSVASIEIYTSHLLPRLHVVFAE